MYIEKLPSGSYRIVQMVNGKKYSATVKEKPSQKEAIEILAQKFTELAPAYKGTFRKAAESYVAAKENVLSPKTIREYDKMVDRLPAWFVDLPLENITQERIQVCVNEMAIKLAPKTVKDRHGFISAVLGLYRPEMKISTSLPQMGRNEAAVPLTEDVNKLLSYIKEHEANYYVAVVLACYSLRRSEICALTVDDIEGNLVHVNKALVENKNNEWVIKSTKTTMSERDIYIPEDIADLIRQQGYVYKGFPGQISKCINRCQKKLGLPEYSLHKLRHYFASRLMELNVDQKTIQELGGWNGDQTVKRIYQHSLAMKSEKRKKQISSKLAKAIL